MATRHGEDDHDVLVGTDGVDALIGYGGNDELKGLGGADYLDGGAGRDLAAYNKSDEGVIVSLATGQGMGGTAQGDTLVSIEDLFGSGHDDMFIGNSGENLLYGGGGNDTLKGGGGADMLDGSSGSDTASYFDSPAGVIVTLYNGEAAGGDAEGDEFYKIENVTGSAYADSLGGSDLSNVLTGGNGDDWLKGFGGADALYGGNGHDEIVGGSGDDTLRGDAGNDLITGSSGRDTLTGGSGADTFFWWYTNETGTTNGTADVVSDFSFAQGDRIDLSGIDANVYGNGNQAFTFIGEADFSGSPGEINYIHSGGNTYVQLQTGTSGDVEGVIRLSGIHTPQASWFIL